ncbi:MAG: exonuclease SbcCD subunit D [Methanosarcinales archaeon]|nr:exonuclease SbcCD subunit D [Methanosarcinales archaeon]
MKILHLADSHLGFSNFSRVDRVGRNLMEEKIYQGFERVVDRILEIRPDAVVHAGDVFHHVRPRIRPLYVFKKGLERLQEAGIPVVVISGNHDAPKSYAAVSPFLLFEGMRDVHIAHRYSYQSFEVGDHTFHCIPFCLSPEDYLPEFHKIAMTGDDVLVMHGLVEALGNHRMMTVGEHQIKDSLLKSDFHYIALGHYHNQARISENAWYSGSVEYFNFGEARDCKGMLLVDLESGRATPVPVHAPYMVDHSPVDCLGLSPGQILEEIQSRSCQAEDRIVRINLFNVDRSSYRRINPAQIGQLGSKALYLKVRVQYVDEPSPGPSGAVDALRLPDEFRKFMDVVRGELPRAIQEEVMSYGSQLIRGAVESRNTEALDAPQ